MAKFITGNGLNHELENIFENAQTQLLLISPYIKLHDRYISSLKAKMNDPELQIIIVFGKNEEDLTRSMKEEDFNFFKQFPNIEIRYEKRLHAKYYANENNAILTSMNLYSYSQDNNIEFGVMTKNSRNSLDAESWNYFNRVVDQAQLLYKREPVFESVMLGLSKKYIESVIEVDDLSAFFNEKDFTPSYKKRNSFKTSFGYCIRTKEKIEFNIQKPMSDQAFKSWAAFKNEDYPEKYCHFSGEVSNGETTYAKPILNKNWRKAKEQFNF